MTSVKPAEIKWVNARFSHTCPICKAAIRVGDRVGQPQTINKVGGRVYVGAWYCAMDAELIAAEGERIGVPFLTQDDKTSYDVSVASEKARIRSKYGKVG